MDSIRCDFDPATYLVISEEVAPLIYYSHFVALFAALAIALFVFFNNPRKLSSQLFLLFALVFSAWAFLDVILWATNDPGVVLFSWAIQVLAEPTLYAIAFYLFYVFLHNDVPSFRLNLFIFFVMFPLVLFLPTNLNVENVYLSFCETDEGPLAQYYTYFANLILIILTVYQGIKGIPGLTSDRKYSARYFIIGLIIFLLSFTVANAISSYTEDWNISQYGLFGMPIFAALIAYSIVQFKAFQIQVAGAQILVVALLASVASSLFVGPTFRTAVTIFTLAVTSIAGLFLIRSVRKEFEQRLELEKLTDQLKKANARLKQLDKMKSEFVSIASHQLRSPLTSIRGYASMLLEGSYGKIPDKAQQALERIADSSKHMVDSVEDYLNVSRIESGNMKYEMSDFNLRDEAEKVVDELRQVAMKKGLLLTFRSDLESQGIVNADIGKTRQALHNLINNSLKYTNKGSITVTVGESKGKKKNIWVAISDTGIGMSQETIDGLFAKFSRAKDANKTNTSGTGLGLFVAKQMIEHMGGTICCESKGEGKGSTFTLELPLQQ